MRAGLVWLALLPGSVCGVAAADGMPAPAHDLADRYATCAAYYFNASNARPMREYEALYQAGERARNRALRYVDASAVDRLVGDASAAMTTLTGGDWRRFERVEARYAAACESLAGEGEPAATEHR